MKDLNANDIEGGDADDRRLRPLDGPRGGGERSWQAEQAPQGGLRRASIREKVYRVDEAITIVKSNAKAKFDETVEIALNLGVDPRHADQMVRGVVTLPHGTGKTVRVAVFAKGDKAEEARAAGADVVGAEDLVEQVQGGTDRFRPLHRHARHDGHRRPAGQGARPEGPDAEPEARHGHAERRARPSRRPRAARSSSASRRPGSSMPASARRASTRTSCARTFDAFVDAIKAQAGRRQGQIPEEGRAQLDHGPRREGRSAEPERLTRAR